MQNEKKIICQKIAPLGASRMVETLFRCKWSLTVLHLLDQGINRPGKMVRAVEGLSKKVLHDCLNRQVEFGIIRRIEYSEVPPRVEYEVTPLGEKFVLIVQQVEALQEEMNL